MKKYFHYFPLVLFLLVEIILLCLIYLGGFITPNWILALVQAGLAFSLVYVFRIEANKKVSEGKTNTALRLMFGAGGLFFIFIYSALKNIF